MSNLFNSLLNCPQCSGSLQLTESKNFICVPCQTEFPCFEGIPWLFPIPQNTLSFWRDNLKYQLLQTENECLSLQNSLGNPELFESQRQRLKKWAEAKKEFTRSLERILAPLISASGLDLNTSAALRDKIPMTQRLGSYLQNLYRDWSWGDENGENQASLAILLELLKDHSQIDQMLVLGSGACRLPYELHRSKKVSLTVASDINPLFLLLAKNLISGQIQSLFEFPVSPIDRKSFYLRRELKAPEALNDGFHFILADGMNPPFSPSSFDALLTPWFIDIVPQDPKTLFRRFNFLLKPGGLWINFGSCYFNHPDFARRYAPEEILEIAADSGFAISKSIIRKIPYLQSPASAHGRVETTFSFLAEKVREVEQPPRFVYLPDWILDPTQPIPQNPIFTQFVSVHVLYTQVINAIDGKTSLERIAQDLGPKFGINPQDAVYSFGRFITKIYESGLTLQSSWL